MNERIIKQTTIRGYFALPIGVSFFNFDVSNRSRTILVSTVCLDGAHSEDPLGIMEAETGFETAVFLSGYTTAGPLFLRSYNSRRSALSGHKKTVAELLATKLPLAIPLTHYCAYEEIDGDKTEHEDSVKSNAIYRGAALS